MPAIPEDYVPTPSTPDHWVPMSTRIQERRDRAEDARGGKGKGKEKGKEKGSWQGESDEVPRPTIYTAAFGTVYHVRPSCGKLRCASRIFRHEAFTPAHASRYDVVG